jgi:hypothetical protein
MRTILQHCQEIFAIVGVEFNFATELRTLADICTVGSSNAPDAGRAHSTVLTHLNNTSIDSPGSTFTLERENIDDICFFYKITNLQMTTILIRHDDIEAASGEEYTNVHQYGRGFGTHLVSDETVFNTFH